MVLFAMVVSPRETRFVRYGWRNLICASLFFAAMPLFMSSPAAAEEPRYFRIGTAATGGSFFEIGGLIASAISRPADGPDCEHGGSCGVPGLVAVAQATLGSVENLRQINSGQLDSGFAQADLAAWAYKARNLFAAGPPLDRLRAIATLFPESVHIAVRADSSIHTLSDLKGKTVSTGDPASGTAVAMATLLAAAGLDEHEINRSPLRPGPAIEELRQGRLDAVCLIGGYPMPAIRDLAGTIPIRLIPVEGSVVDRLRKDFSFYGTSEIPAGTYAGVDSATPSLSFSAVWLVGADIDDDLVYTITKSLWNPATLRPLAGLDQIANRIKLSHALDGLPVPLHSGAARFYGERGMLADRVSEQPSLSTDIKKQ